MKIEAIKEELLNKFSFLQDKIQIPRERRIFLEVPQDKFFELFEYVTKKFEFDFLSAITGLDEGPSFGVIYHISKADGCVLSIKISVPRDNLVIKTITSYFSSADIYEREMVDLLGIKVEGLKIDKRYPLPDDWPEGEYPLRKDWSKERLKK